MTTYARVPMGEAFDTLATELDDILGRIVRADATLRVEYHPARVFLGPWVVRDLANDGEIMVVRESEEDCRRWAAAFVARTPGSRLEEAAADGPPSLPDTIPAAASSSRLRVVV